MKIHSTNYLDTFIEVADDCPNDISQIPLSKADSKSIAVMQYELLIKNPYKYTSDDILFQLFADRNDILKSEYEQARIEFFSKGQACFRASPLTKKLDLVCMLIKMERLRSLDEKPKNMNNF
jgi:hypothetical protein